MTGSLERDGQFFCNPYITRVPQNAAFPKRTWMLGNRTMVYPDERQESPSLWLTYATMLFLTLVASGCYLNRSSEGQCVSVCTWRSFYFSSIVSPTERVIVEVRWNLSSRLSAPDLWGSKESEQKGNLILERDHVSEPQRWVALTRSSARSVIGGRKEVSLKRPHWNEHWHEKVGFHGLLGGCREGVLSV